jgi:nucleoside-diphosphate-sugar epimerase
MSKRVLVTGGAGFLGINLIRFLLSRNCVIRSYDFAEFTYPDVRDAVEVVRKDIRDKQAVDQAMAGIDWVVHCAAALPLYKPRDIYTTDVEGTRNILESAKKHRVQRVVHISSTAVYGIPDHHPLVETDRLEGVGNYGKAKIEAEEVCMAFRNAGMCIPILRPKSFIGPERLGVFALLFDWAKDGRGFPMIGNGKNRYQLLDVEDLCEAVFSSLILDENRVNDTFNIGAKQFETMKEDYQAVLDYAGFGKKIKTFPAAPVIFALRILEALKLSPLYKWVYETASKDSFVSIEKAEKQLNFIPKYSNQQALIRNYQWYIDHLETFSSDVGISHRTPWKQGVLKIVKRFF